MSFNNYYQPSLVTNFNISNTSVSVSYVSSPGYGVAFPIQIAGDGFYRKFLKVSCEVENGSCGIIFYRTDGTLIDYDYYHGSSQQLYRIPTFSKGTALVTISPTGNTSNSTTTLRNISIDLLEL